MNKAPMDIPFAARSAIERVIWREGITGDAFARVATRILDALAEAGFMVTSRSE